MKTFVDYDIMWNQHTIVMTIDYMTWCLNMPACWCILIKHWYIIDYASLWVFDGVIPQDYYKVDQNTRRIPTRDWWTFVGRCVKQDQERRAGIILTEIWLPLSVCHLGNRLDIIYRKVTMLVSVACAVWCGVLCGFREWCCKQP